VDSDQAADGSAGTGGQPGDGRPGPLEFQERLWVPWWWWPFAGVIIAMFVAEVIPGLPGSWQVWSGVIITAIVVSWLITVSVAPVGITAQGLHAGSATLPYAAVGAVRIVEPRTRKALLGPSGQDGAFLLTRDWVRGAIYVEVVGDDDPTPYWLVSTRHPDRLAAALRRADDDGPTTF
jgi:Protein of unknown function (DUF3093)